MAKQLLSIVFLLLAGMIINAAEYQVTNLDNAGFGSLREAIDSANTNIGLDSITFAVSGRLSLITQLPDVTDDSVYFLGSTAPSGIQSFIIDGSAVDSGNGLTLVGSSQSLVEGLTIEGFTGVMYLSGKGIDFNNSSDTAIIQDNIIQDCATGIKLGGEGHVISNNTIVKNGTGINFYQAACHDNLIIANYIGTNAASDTGLGNGCGLRATYSSYDNVIRDNIISGAGLGDANVEISGYGYELYGNKIGTTVDGQSALIDSPGCVGVSFNGEAHDNIVGGAGPGQSGNVIAGNHRNISLAVRTYNNTVQANVIGTNIDGTVSLGSSYGISLHTTDPPGGNNTIGGPNPEDGNLISGNSLYGIYISSTNNIFIQNNLIGTDSSGQNAIPNRMGIGMIAGDSVSIFDNVISGNDSCGISLSVTTRSFIYNNTIGLTADQSQPLGNAFDGISLRNSSMNNIIGPGNIIAHNGLNGIGVADPTCLYNRFRENSIYENQLLGIDLGLDGVTLNDSADIDDGANDLLNYPEILGLILDPLDPTQVTITGVAERSAIVEMFLAGDTLIDPDPSGHGEALTFLDLIYADDSGYFVFNTSNDYLKFTLLTFTTTDTLGNTSEFSPNFSLPPGPLVVTAYSPVNLWVTDPEGNYIGKDAAGDFFQTILPVENADYTEDAPDYYDIVTIHYPLPGDYDITIIPEDDAPSGEDYSVTIRLDGSHEVVIVQNADVPMAGSTDNFSYTVEDGYHYINGDANRDEILNILDITFIINYLYKGGDTPYPEGAGDANCNDIVNILDITYLINYLYREGEPPCNLEEIR